VEIGPVDRITTDAVGEPGRRTFYLQARAGSELITVTVEKQQVELLAASILDILERVGQETEEAEEQMDLEEPLEPRWRVGRLSIGYAAERDQLMLELEELVPDLEDEEVAEQVGAPEPDRIRLWASRAQTLTLSRHDAEETARSRPD